MSTFSEVKLDDKYTSFDGRVYLSGIQALIRLPLVQRMRDEAAGLNTAGFVSGYRGSPLGGLDTALTKAKKYLEPNHIHFQPGVNEELAATAVWGTQQVDLIGPSKFDGVFSLWYGKGPGVDRCGDVFKHMNYAGTSKHGGVLLVAGDDHAAHSSTLPHQSDHLFSASMIPVLYPCNVQEMIELGLHGWAMSRFSGCTVGFKVLADTVETSGSIDADPFATKIIIPDEFKMPVGGLNARTSTETLGVHARVQEALMQDYKIYAALAYARANKLNRCVINPAEAKLGIVASGKSYLDVLEALSELGIDEQKAEALGIRLFKVSMPWPLEPEGIRAFAQGLDEILVVEEKRQLVEYQLKEQLYNWRDDTRPKIVGKFDEKGEWVAPRGEWLLPAKSEFTIAQVARVIAARIARFHSSETIAARLKFLEAKECMVESKAVQTPVRPAYYCSGCPHNTSTKTPEGSFALAGIGCHVMAASIYPDNNKLITHMGGEGVPWVGQAKYSEVEHVFANLGDGTYYHSGLLAVRAANAANVNITYKILFNDAVAMTGGQPFDGPISVLMIARQIYGEGIQRIALVTEDLNRYTANSPQPQSEFPANVTFHDRSEMDAVQRELREIKGVSVIIYDQTCAAEKRRRRKKGLYPDPNTRLIINEAVCEGCGDCGIQSNCTSLVPVETELGRKRAVDQSSCNKDYSCVKGFCPSFVTVEGGTLKKLGGGDTRGVSADHLPEPVMASLAKPFNILVTGIGGTGVITIGALLGMAAHLEGKGCSVLDMTGMSQKNGAVTSHVKISSGPNELYASRIAAGEADLILGCDMLTAAAPDAIAKMQAGRSFALINDNETMPGQFAKQRDWQYPKKSIVELINESVDNAAAFVRATDIATALMGDSIATNLFMLGYAWQLGKIPVSRAAIERAIELNGVAAQANLDAFAWGRLMQYAPEQVMAALPQAYSEVREARSLEESIRYRVAHLSAYQNEAYAAEYTKFLESVQTREDAIFGDKNGYALTQLVAKSFHRLMAYKDEYEVARLFTDESFKNQISQQFEGDYKISFNLAPPLFSKRDPHTGHLIKRRFPSVLMLGFRMLALLKILRGTRYDPFGKTQERKMERALIGEYRDLVIEVLGRLNPDNYQEAIALLSLVDQVRGFGHVKEASVVRYRAELKFSMTKYKRDVLHAVEVYAA
jgi:indolepyruvate ferredoxin oxidoreductase